MQSTSTETVPMCWREKVRPAIPDKLTSVRRRVTNRSLPTRWSHYICHLRKAQ